MTNHEQEEIVCGDFVPPPSCWFESSPPLASARTDKNLKHLVVDETDNANHDLLENSPLDLCAMKLIPAVTGTTTSNAGEVIQNKEQNVLERNKRQEQKEEHKETLNHVSDNSPEREVVLLASTRSRVVDLPISSDIDVVVGNTRPSPSWREISSQVLPAAAKELFSSSVRRLYYTAKISYSRGRWHRKYSDIGQNAVGFSISSSSTLELPQHLSELPSFSSLPWVDRQLVQEWRTYLPENQLDMNESEDSSHDWDQARTLVPCPIARPKWKKSDVCHTCHKPFGPVRLRHHCRSCGHSFCQDHSMSTHRLPHLGYDDVPERVCDSCKRILEDQNLAERVAWRLARCRDFKNNSLTPYFETGVDSVEEVALRVTRAAIAMAKSIPLGAQATVAVETVNVLRKYGLQGIYGIMLRQEFLAAADLLCKALGINKTSWPLSVHELSAAIFYALAQHRAMRGLSPDHEEILHSYRSTDCRNSDSSTSIALAGKYETSAGFNEEIGLSCHISESKEQQGMKQDKINDPPSQICVPVCDPVPDKTLASLLFYAPIALNFIYATKEVEMQLLAAQQGWRLLYAFLHQDMDSVKPCDRPASAIFLHQEHKILCLSIRGTATINDVITDIRQTPVSFPNVDIEHRSSDRDDSDWTTIDRGQGLALCGMASAASNLFYEHIDSIMEFVKQGFRVRIVGHSLGGGVATMIGVLVQRHLEHLGYGTSTGDEKILKVYAYGTPSCFDSKLADSVKSFVTTVVLHDDVFPRLTPTSCRGLLKHLLYIRETWVKTHIEEDLRAVGERAKTLWAPRFRQNFALLTQTSSIKKYCKKQILRGTSKLMPADNSGPNEASGEDVDGTVEGFEECHSKDEFCDCNDIESLVSDPSEWGEKFFVPTTNLPMTSSGEEKLIDSNDTHAVDNSTTQLLLEFLGGGDNGKEGIIIDGDEFFETSNGPVGENDDTIESIGDEYFGDPIGEIAEETLIKTDGSWSLESHKSESSPTKKSFSIENDDDIDPAAVVLDETPLPHMYLPGKIVHIYSHRGVYKAAYVPCTFKSLRRISLAGNMLSNHTTKSYFESLLEVQTARVANESPPRWTAYDEDDTCCCCANRFTWASTSSSEAQEARDKHNCRSCGGLICDPCSKNRVPVPSIGLTVPVRVCDRCYNDIMGGVSSTSTSVDRSANNFSITRENEEKKNKPERSRQKRSAVVDDLVSRMRASALA